MKIDFCGRHSTFSFISVLFPLFQRNEISTNVYLSSVFCNSFVLQRNFLPNYKSDVYFYLAKVTETAKAPGKESIRKYYIWVGR